MSDLFEHRPYAIVPCDKGSNTYRVKRYRERAEELRAIAADLVSEECHGILVRLANTYDEMASNAALGGVKVAGHA